MQPINAFAEIHPVLRILLIVVFTVAAHLAVKAVRRFSQYLLAMKVDDEITSEVSLTRKTASYEIKVTDVGTGALIASCQALAYRTGKPIPFV